MEKETRLVQADRQLTVELGGNRFRIVTSDTATVDLLRHALGDSVVDGDAFLGFELTLAGSDSPAGQCASRRVGSGLSTLVDCAGTVLARSREPNDVLAALAGHLAATELGPPSPSVERYRLRALVGRDHLVLVAPPVFTRPPLVALRLEPLGYRIADAPMVDVESASLTALPIDVPWPELAGFDAGPGHASPQALAKPVTHLLWPAIGGPGDPSPAEVCHALASAALARSRDQRLSDAERLAGRVEVVPVADAGPFAALGAIAG